MTSLLNMVTRRTKTITYEVYSNIPTGWRSLSRNYTLFAKVALEVWNQFQLLLYCKVTNDGLKYRTNSNMVYPDEATIVYIYKHTHKEPATICKISFDNWTEELLTDNPSDRSSHHGQEYCDQSP